MIYTMNGMADDLWLQADRPGVFAGRSAHFSGDGFSDMTFTVRAEPPAEFADWVAKTGGDGPILSQSVYAELARQSRKVAPYTYRSVSPDLFEDIVRQRLAPGPGPSAAPATTPAGASTQVSSNGKAL
jgi:cytochrome o ubiquinol oxidase subunit 2